MGRQYKILIFLTISFLITLSSCSDVTNNSKLTNEKQEKVYSNPIDEYFLPRIDNAMSEAERREYQDTYRKVWKSEFDNIMCWMYDKCIYQVDKDRLIAYEESIRQLIDVTYDVVITDWLDNYILPPDSPDRSSRGNGTHSGLNQVQAEIYRDAGTRLINKEYKFLDIDYSKQQGV